MINDIYHIFGSNWLYGRHNKKSKSIEIDKKKCKF